MVTVIEAPRVSIEGPRRVAVGVPATFRATTSFVEGAGDAEVDWQLPGGETAEGPTVSYSFAEPGVYEVALTARFAGGRGECGAIGTLLEVVANAPPVADAGGPRSVAVLEALLFDASGSSDPDGAITSYVWDFGDGTTATGVQARHQYNEPGVHELVLTITDDAGVKNSVATLTEEITLNPNAVAGLEAPWPLCPGEGHTWTAAAENGTSAV